MRATIEMSEGLERLKKILADRPIESQEWNEAQNRLQFIDRLLIECLGWSHPDIEVEHQDEAGGKSDYNLGRPLKATLEAKREAVGYDILPGTKPEKSRKLRSLIDACPKLKSSVLQVLNYCTLNGAQLAIVCNGPQLVLFQTNTAGQAPLDGDCFVFDGFSTYVDGFPTLWKTLSPEGIEENRAYRLLAANRNLKAPPKAFTNIGEPSAYRYRNPFQENLRALASVLLEDIESNPAVKSDFYRECYVTSEANNRHLLLSKRVIENRYKRVADNGVTPASANARVEGTALKIEDAALAVSNGSRPVVVIGDVGVGKTSFFENLFENIPQSEKSKTYFIHLDLGESATLADNVKTYFLSYIPKVLRESYGIKVESAAFLDKVYKQEIEDFDDQIEGRLKHSNPDAYNQALVDYLRKKVAKTDEHIKASFDYIVKVLKKQIIIVIDNADQRDFGVQQEAFLIAQELAASRNLLVFVALRPSTFYLSKLSGALSGYQNRVLTIAPPPADEVVRKRLMFAVRVAEGKIAPAALEGVHLNINSIVHFLNATLRSIKTNNRIRTFLSNITGGNTRLVIELVSSFCGSPNVESQRIVEIESSTGEYVVPLHEFTKHALLGEYAHYNPLSSTVACNVFDIYTADAREHFLGCLIVAYLTSALGTRDNDGFVQSVQVMNEMERLGFMPESSRQAIRKLATKRLIETPHGHYREVPVPDDTNPDQFSFRGTSIGIYHIRFWVGSFSFLDATSIDTPIFDENIRRSVFNSASSFDIRDRNTRATQFKSYLETQWHIANFDIEYYDLPSVLQAEIASFDSVKRAIDERSSGGRKKNWWPKRGAPTR